MRRYALLFALVVVAGAALVLFARPRPDAGPREEPVAEAPLVELRLGIENGAMAPERASVPVGSRVRIEIENRDAAPAAVALPGYEDRVNVGTLEPGARWSGEFLADRPGDDFGWTIDGRPAGRFEVAGSHLIEGHR